MLAGEFEAPIAQCFVAEADSEVTNGIVYIKNEASRRRQLDVDGEADWLCLVALNLFISLKKVW